ncbi:MAG: DUF4381 domain-containing protein [Legionellales bacterium]|nr:DUF4381 domain-containing protein [Legionellales bacterium]
MNSTDPLSQLKPLHLPPAITFWPPAPGWLILSALVIFMSAGIVYYFIRRYQNQRGKRFALQQLHTLQQQFAQPDYRPQIISNISQLLKRVALLHHPRQQVAGLTGTKWLQFLDESGHTQDFQHGIGKILISAPYNQHIPENAEELFPLVKRWIEKNA